MRFTKSDWWIGAFLFFFTLYLVGHVLAASIKGDLP